MTPCGHLFLFAAAAIRADGALVNIGHCTTCDAWHSWALVPGHGVERATGATRADVIAALGGVER